MSYNIIEDLISYLRILKSILDVFLGLISKFPYISWFFSPFYFKKLELEF